VGMKERPIKPSPASESSPELRTAADFGHEIRTFWSPNGGGTVRRNVVEVKGKPRGSFIGQRASGHCEFGGGGRRIDTANSRACGRGKARETGDRKRRCLSTSRGRIWTQGGQWGAKIERTKELFPVFVSVRRRWRRCSFSDLVSSS
jgi:hypothetical protein